MNNAVSFLPELEKLASVLNQARTLLLTAPAAADGDSIGAQLALVHMLHARYPTLQVHVINDEPLPDRYQFMPRAQEVRTPTPTDSQTAFDLGIVVDGGIDRAGNVRSLFDKCQERVFIDHHIISANYPYTIRIVEPSASSTTELIFHLSQQAPFSTIVEKDFAQCIYLGLIFDTGFFRHSNTTPEALELGALLVRTGFDFTRVGERGMLERSFTSLKLLADTLARAELALQGQVIWSTLTQDHFRKFQAAEDDREGIIDHLFLTHGIEVAMLFSELAQGGTKVSFRSQGAVDVASFARGLTEQGGGHKKAAGAFLAMSLERAVKMVLENMVQVLPPRKAASAPLMP